MNIETTKQRLWANGYLIGIISIHGCPVRPDYQDAEGRSYKGGERDQRNLAALHISGLEVTEIQFFEGRQNEQPNNRS